MRALALGHVNNAVVARAHSALHTHTHTFVSVMSVKRYKATMYDAILEKKRAMHVPIQ